jgi:hypothetical protein
MSMATFRLRHFSSPETLRAIHPDHLLRFLDPHRPYLAQRGVILPAVGSGQLPNYEALTHVLMTPDSVVPDALIDALYHVDEIATPDGMDSVLQLVSTRGLSLDVTGNESPADVAVIAFLLDPDIVLRVHGEALIERPRSFTSFCTRQPPPPCPEIPASAAVDSLEAALASWFHQRQRGRAAHVSVIDRTDERFFLVRHGQPFKREARLDEEEPSSIAFRPLKHDVLAYNPRRGELRINAETPGEKRLYVREFSRLLFNTDDAFPCVDKYTLEPLRADGPRCLGCTDVDGLEAVTLCEVHLDWNGPHRDVEIRKSSDVFAALAAHGIARLPEQPKLTQAVFAFSYAGESRPRRVRIRVPNVAQYTRDEDCARVEEWLQRRGFLDVQPLS